MRTNLTTRRWTLVPLILALVAGLFALPAGAAEKQLRIGMWSAPSSFSPISNPSGYGDAAIHLIYDALVDHSDTFEYVPGLARAWSVHDGNTRFVFELHPDARWHDGEPVTADDVVFTYWINAHPETVSVNGQALNVIQGTGSDGKLLPGEPFGVEKIDDYTVAIRTKFPMPEDVFLTRVASRVHIVPKHVLEPVPPAELHRHESAMRPTVGSGPFRFVQYRTDQYVELVKHEAYHKGTPKIDRVFLVIQPGATMTAALEQGVIDITAGGGIGEVPITDWNRIQASPHLQPVPYTPMVYQVLLINHAVPGFDDPRVRRALALAIDRQRIADRLLQGLAELHPTPLNSNNPYFDPELVETVRHDPEEARRLLVEAGFDFSRTVTILTPTGNVARERSATLIQADLAAVGIRAQIELADFTTAFARMREGDYELGLLGMRTSFDPDLSSDVGTGGETNYTGYANPEMDDLLARAAASLDPEERMSLYREVQRLYVAEMPAIILNTPKALTVVNKRVINARPGANGPPPAGLFWNPEQWDVVE